MADLSRKSDVDTTILVSLEERENEPRWGTLRRIARALDTELEDLLGQAEHLEREIKHEQRRR